MASRRRHEDVSASPQLPGGEGGALASLPLDSPPNNNHPSPPSSAAGLPPSASVEFRAPLPRSVLSCARCVRRNTCGTLGYGTARFRFTQLVLVCIVVFSGYFSYDLPGITSEELKTDLGITNTQLGLLFSVYAFPNAVMPLLSGVYYAGSGAWKGVLVIATVIFSGVALVGLGAAHGSFLLMLLGRAVYGLGGESLFIGVDVLATDWFKHAELGLAYGMIQSAGQAGSFAAFYGVPWLSEATGGFVTAYHLGTVLSAVALGCLVLAHALEQVVVDERSDAIGGGLVDDKDAAPPPLPTPPPPAAGSAAPFLYF